MAERSVVPLAGTTEADGTGDDGICEAVRALGCTATPYETAEAKAAWGWLVDSLRVGRPVILCVDDWQHWVTALGMAGDRVVVFDPANTAKNSAENGIFVGGKRELMRRWRGRRSDRFSGIAVGKK